MKKILYTISIIALSANITSCSTKGQAYLPLEEKTVELSGLGDDHWTYFSVEDGIIVGTSKFLSEEEDALWAKKSDWDIAICGDYIKTNGGTSGKCLGAIMRDTEHNYLLLEEAPTDGYLIDELLEQGAK